MIILFDGVCNLCNGLVNFIIEKDKKNIFKLSPLQSAPGLRLMNELAIPGSEMSSIILIDGNKYYQNSSAVLRILKNIKSIWKIFYVLIILPPFLRDFFYKLISNKRYRWFGKRNECMIPEEKVLQKFLM